MNLLTHIRSLFEPVLAELAPDQAKVPDYLAAIKPAANPEHGDYQANFAMALAKALGQKPPDVAKEIIAQAARRTTCSNRRRSPGRGSSTCG